MAYSVMGMTETKTLRGFATINLWADDLEAAKQWYSEFLGQEPYFEKPGYYEFRVGDYQHELGLVDSRFAPGGTPDKPSGVLMYWHVDDLEGTFERLLSMGATQHHPVIKRGEGFVTAAVVDPFGNVLGIMYNKHYLEVLPSWKA